LLPPGFYQPGVVAIPIRNLGDGIHLGWLQKKNSALLPEAKTFIDLLKDCLKDCLKEQST
jgi:hypothetical protein